MKSITYIGMDVHTTNYTLCCYSVEDDRFFAEIEVKPDYQEVLKYINRVKNQRGKETEILCGYEAGCLGYSLYHQLIYHGVECVILAPSTMPVTPGKKIKTDRMDARRISKCLAYHTYSAVYVPTAEDDAVKEYIRMRDDENNTLRRIKQQTIALCTRHGKQYDGKSYWTKRHLDWLEGLDFGNGVLNEVLKEYLVLYYQAQEKVEAYDKRIEELSRSEKYQEPVEKLGCFIGIKNHTALAFCCEVGDFRRFPSAQQFASYLGLVPGENSSGVNANLKMSNFAETECHFSAVSVEVYTALIHNLTCRLEARQALIYQLVVGLTGENGKYNYSRAVHLYPPFFDITCSAKNYKIAPALTLPSFSPFRLRCSLCRFSTVVTITIVHCTISGAIAFSHPCWGGTRRRQG